LQYKFSIAFALFGRSARKTLKEDLVNSKNQRECEVEVEFEKNNDEYIITI